LSNLASGISNHILKDENKTNLPYPTDF
jgi:hypothetical protein